MTLDHRRSLQTVWWKDSLLATQMNSSTQVTAASRVWLRKVTSYFRASFQFSARSNTASLRLQSARVIWKHVTKTHEHSSHFRRGLFTKGEQFCLVEMGFLTIYRPMRDTTAVPIILFGNLKKGSHSYTRLWNQLRGLLQHRKRVNKPSILA